MDDLTYVLREWYTISTGIVKSGTGFCHQEKQRLFDKSRLKSLVYEVTDEGRKEQRLSRVPEQSHGIFLA